MEFGTPINGSYGIWEKHVSLAKLAPVLTLARRVGGQGIVVVLETQGFCAEQED
jgi:hypothetical protein